jgi:hypothetical protein
VRARVGPLQAYGLASDESRTFLTSLRLLATRLDHSSVELGGLELKHIEAQLRERERQLNTLVANLPGIAYRCRDDGRWTGEFVGGAVKPVTMTSGDTVYLQIVHRWPRFCIRASPDCPSVICQIFLRQEDVRRWTTTTMTR